MKNQQITLDKDYLTCDHTTDSCTREVTLPDGTAIRALMAGHEEHLLFAFGTPFPFFPALVHGYYTYDVKWEE